MSYFRRTYKVVFPTLGITFEDDVRFSFETIKDGTKESNKHKVSLWNLSDATREKIQVADLEVQAYAGYAEEDGAVRMFVGTVYQAETKNDGKDDVTTLHLKDGGVALRDTYLSLSFAPGTAGNTVIKAIASEMQMSTIFGNNVVFSTFTEGYSFCGWGVDALDAICYGSGVSWSVQNNMLQFLMDGDTMQERGIVFSASSGLIGSPERIIKAEKKAAVENPVVKRRRKQKAVKPKHEAGWKIKTLLSANVIPGDKVKVESEIMTGWFRVEGVKHYGDTHGADWKSEFYLIFLG